MLRFLLAIALFTHGNIAFGDIFKCKDANGSVVLTDTPCAPNQVLVERKTTNDANTLGRSTSSNKKESTRAKERSASQTAATAKSATAATSSSDSGCDKMRRDFARQQSQSCIEGLQIVTGKVMCMPEAQRREYLSRKKEVLDAMCS
jgi:Domain of unknown function (DUF4124)